MMQMNILPNFPNTKTLSKVPSLNNSLLDQYLPALARTAHQWNAKPSEAAQYGAQSSCNVMENGGVTNLTVDHLSATYARVLGTISSYQYYGYEAEEKISRYLLECLQDQFNNEERQFADLSEDKYANSRLDFLALSDISKASNSRCIGNVLSELIYNNYSSVLEECRHTMTDGSIAEWAYGIYHANMPSDSKITDLREIIRRAPNVVRWMIRSRSAKWIALGNALQQLEDETVRPSVRNRSRRRRYVSDDEEDDDLSLRPRRRVGGRSRRARDYDEGCLRRRSAPGENRRIANQALRLADRAEDLQDEAEELREMVLRR